MGASRGRAEGRQRATNSQRIVTVGVHLSMPIFCRLMPPFVMCLATRFDKDKIGLETNNSVCCLHK
jgi:hypothetical protein